jgi:hypothetical protein
MQMQKMPNTKQVEVSIGCECGMTQGINGNDWGGEREREGQTH